MAGLTPRFGFNHFGSGEPGSISDDGLKYTGYDRLLLDQLLSQIERHDHRKHPRAEAAIPAPSATLSNVGGSLEGGYTYYYKVSVVDQWGVESVASDQVEVEIPDLLEIPEAPFISQDSTPGSLLPGFYYYAVTALRGAEESPIGAVTAATLIDGETSFLVTMPEAEDADAFSIWRMGSNDAGFTRIGSTSDPTFVDNGSVPADPCACDPGVAPPTDHQGASDYSITITLPPDLDLTTARGWRIYRSNDSDIFDSASLLIEVVERTDEWDESAPLVRSYVDTGDETIAGRPMASDQNMRFSEFTFDGGAELPDPAGYPELYPFVANGRLNFILSGQWVAPANGPVDHASTLPPVAGYPEYHLIVVEEVLYALISGEWVAVGGGGGGGGSASQILTSPGGSRFILTVDDAGALTTVATTLPGPPTPPTSVSVI